MITYVEKRERKGAGGGGGGGGESYYHVFSSSSVYGIRFTGHVIVGSMVMSFEPEASAFDEVIHSIQTFTTIYMSRISGAV